MCYTWKSEKMGTWVFGVVMLLGLVRFGSAIICYECNSATNMLCSEAKLPASLKKNCSEHDKGDVKHTLCRKMIQHVDVLVNGQVVPSRVIRTCGWDDTKYKGACYHRSGFGSRHEVCSCTKDFCNGADDVTPAVGLLSLLALAAAKLAA